MKTHTIRKIRKSEREDAARFIVDAQNTFNSTGLSPKELLEQRDKLAENIEGLLNIFDRGLEKGTIGRRYCDESKQLLETLKKS